MVCVVWLFHVFDASGSLHSTCFELVLQYLTILRMCEKLTPSEKDIRMHCLPQSLAPFFAILLGERAQPATRRLPVYLDGCPLRAASLAEVLSHYEPCVQLSQRLQQLLLLAQRHLAATSPATAAAVAADAALLTRLRDVRAFVVPQLHALHVSADFGTQSEAAPAEAVLQCVTDDGGVVIFVNAPQPDPRRGAPADGLSLSSYMLLRNFFHQCLDCSSSCALSCAVDLVSCINACPSAACRPQHTVASGAARRRCRAGRFPRRQPAAQRHQHNWAQRRQRQQHQS